MDFSLHDLIVAAGALLAVWVGHTLGFRRATNEKIWGLRREAYGVILFELGKAERICDNAQEYIQQEENRYFNSDISHQHNEEISKLLAVASNRFSADYIVLSEAFVVLYEKFQSDLQSGPDRIPPEEHEHFVKVLSKSRPLLLAQARNEIIKKGWSRRFFLRN